MEKNGSTGSPHRRSVGVTVIGVVDYLFGLLLLTIPVFTAVTRPQNLKNYPIVGNILVYSVLAGISLFGYGLIRLSFSTLKLNSKSINRNIIFASFGIFFCCVYFLAGLNADLGSDFKILFHLFLLIYSLWMIFYLTRPKVKRAFGERNPARSVG